MGGGVHWAEWIVPIVGAHHAAYNAAANASGADDAKLVTPTSQLDKKRTAQKLAETERVEAVEAQQDQQRLAEQQRVAGLPENVSRRASATSRVLGESGKRPTASQYLAGS
jgi:hypothetical protein